MIAPRQSGRRSAPSVPGSCCPPSTGEGYTRPIGSGFAGLGHLLLADPLRMLLGTFALANSDPTPGIAAVQSYRSGTNHAADALAGDEFRSAPLSSRTVLTAISRSCEREGSPCAGRPVVKVSGAVQF